MRPGVYASVMRDRKTGTRRVNPQPHQYSWRRFFIMISVGALLFVPGLIVTIIGIETEEEVEDVPSDKVLYKFIGPAALAVGIALLCASGIYYCCWGFQSPVRRPHSKHKKGKKHGEQYDPLQAKSVPAISNNTPSTYSNTRSHGSPRKKSPRGNGDKVYSSPSTPDKRSDRHGNHHHHHHYSAHRTSSKTSIDTASIRSHPHSISRHRGSSHSHHTHDHASSPHAPLHNPDNQVAFVNTDAPLAQGESGSMDISIDIEGGIIETEKKY